LRSETGAESADRILVSVLLRHFASLWRLREFQAYEDGCSVGEFGRGGSDTQGEEAD